MNAMMNSTGPQIGEKTVPVWNSRINMRVKQAGNGPDLLYLHPAAGLHWDPFLSYLAEHYTVYAPEFPGTSRGDPYAIHAVHTIADMVLAYEELVRALGLINPVLVGQSFGGMLAGELAAAFPSMAPKVVLLDPIGLWRDDLPYADWVSAPPDKLPGILFKDPSSAAAQSMLALPADPSIIPTVMAAMVWAVGCTAKFAWPIPDRGLRSRLHRLTAKTLLVWGRDDALAPVGYVDEWRKELRNSQSVIIEDCGHIPQVEKLSETIAAVSAFLLPA